MYFPLARDWAAYLCYKGWGVLSLNCLPNLRPPPPSVIFYGIPTVDFIAAFIKKYHGDTGLGSFN